MAARLGAPAAASLALLSGHAAASMAGNKEKATPISKVLDMMEEMHAKGVKTKQDEEVKFSAFWEWCGGQTRIKNNEIAKATDTMAQLTASIEKGATHIKQLTDRILELEEDIGRWTKDRKSASDVRAKEKTDYESTSQGLSETLTAVDNALITLKKQAGNTAQASLVQASLLQVQRSRFVPLSSKRVVESFLEDASSSVEDGAGPDERLLRGAPEANAYESQSGGVIQMLEDLKDKFGKQKYDLDVEEANAQHAFEQIIQQLTDNEENAQHEINKKTDLRAKTQQQKATDEADLAQTTVDRAEDQKYLDEMTALCGTKKSDFESRQQLRADELTAIQKAIDIISSSSVKGAGDKHLPASALAQVSGATSLAQVHSSAKQQDVQARLASFLAGRAQTYNSKLLATVAEQIKVTGDPFTKVKKMVKDLIWKLMEEATAETEHKGWCDTELGTNKQTRDKKTEELNQLVAQEEDLTAQIAGLTSDIEDLTNAIAELESQRAEATDNRADSKAKNEETISDAKDAQTAVENAMAVLKEFYAKSAQATALAQLQQGPAGDAPETFDDAYKGQQDGGGNVVSFLEVILSDFARLESETTAEESAESEEYKKFMHESEMDKSLKENEKKHKEDRKADNENSLQGTKEDMKMTQEALDDAVTYYEKLKPTCVDSGATYEDRVKRREAEMQSLKEALNILKGTDIDLA